MCKCGQNSGGCGCGSKCCKDECDQNQCQSNACCGKCEESCEQDIAKKFFELADCAWMEVLKDKIKLQIQNNSDENLDELARIISEGNKERWKNKMIKKGSKCSFHDKIMDFFHQSCKGACKSNGKDLK